MSQRILLRIRRFARVPAFAAAVALLNSGCSTDPSQATVWGSDLVSLQVAENKTTVRFLASGGCYGSFGTIDQVIPAGDFALPGSFTQLTGAYPGSVRYSAEYTAVIDGDTMTLSASVPELATTLGPFQLKAGVAKSWPACLYP